MFVLRAGDPHAAAKLSALAQSIGYFLAGLIGPFAVGVIYDWTGSWPVVAVFYSAVGLASLIFGLGAGRARLRRTRGGFGRRSGRVNITAQFTDPIGPF